jgi:hypothetical protein
MLEAIDALKPKCDSSAPSAIDAPTDLFRAQLVVELLRACAPYFMSGILKERLSRFLPVDENLGPESSLSSTSSMSWSSWP